MPLVRDEPVLIQDGQNDAHVTANENFALLADGYVYDLTVSGATTDVPTTIPAGSRIDAVTVRVVTAITGATSFNVGDTGDGGALSANATRYASGIGITLGATGGGFVGAWTVNYAGAVTIRLTAVGSNFTGGVVRVRVAWAPRTIPSA
jgi:hypothetical protein